MPYRVDVLTLFPQLFDVFFDCSLIGRARKNDLLQAQAWNIRQFADPPHFKVDDVPYGGGAGMVMNAEPVMRSIEAVKRETPETFVIYLCPSGYRLNQSISQVLADKKSGITLLCGRYEGIDERVLQEAVDLRLSLGDFVLMGGEVAAMAVMEAVVRLLPGVLGNNESVEHESFALRSPVDRSVSSQIKGEGLLEGPQYTRPFNWRGKSVPEVLLSGNHQDIVRWRYEMAESVTARMRPDLLGGK
jgi:tRNA (guanine37-N1)-methyltransferase